MKKKLKILCDLQLSSLTSLNDGKFLFTVDSNVNVITFTLKILCKHTNWDFYLLVPELKTFNARVKKLDDVYDLFTDTLNKKRIKLIEYPYYGNPFIDRMSFNPDSLKELRDINLVYTNNPTWVLPYKTFFYGLTGKFLPVISRNHWVTGWTHRKIDEKIDFNIRQTEGAIYGDLMSFNSKFAINLFLKNTKEFFNKKVHNLIKNKLVHAESVDIDKISKLKKLNWELLEKDFFSIIWPHRLSYYTGWEKTFDALKKIDRKKYPFLLYVPDPGNKFTQKELVKRYSFISPINKKEWTHEKYIELCNYVDLVIGNHQYPATWGGLAITEPMAAGVMPLLLNKYAYKEMFNVKWCFFNDEKEMIEKIKILIKNPVISYQNGQKAKEFIYSHLNQEQYVKKIISWIVEVLKKYEN